MIKLWLGHCFAILFGSYAEQQYNFDEEQFKNSFRTVLEQL